MNVGKKAAGRMSDEVDFPIRGEREKQLAAQPEPRLAPPPAIQSNRPSTAFPPTLLYTAPVSLITLVFLPLHCRTIQTKARVGPARSLFSEWTVSRKLPRSVLRSSVGSVDFLRGNCEARSSGRQCWCATPDSRLHFAKSVGSLDVNRRPYGRSKVGLRVGLMWCTTGRLGFASQSC